MLFVQLEQYFMSEVRNSAPMASTVKENRDDGMTRSSSSSALSSSENEDNLPKDIEGNGGGKVAFRASRTAMKFNLLKLFEKLHGSDIDFVKWLRECKLLGKEYECPLCGREMHLAVSKRISDGYEWQCQRKIGATRHNCRRSIRKGTWFEKSKLTLGEIMLVTYGWVYEWTNKFILREVKGFSSCSLIEWKNICRDVCLDALVCADNTIGGEGCVVEVIECEFEKRKGNTVQVPTWVYVGMECDSSNCFIVPVSEKSKDVLLDIIKRRILPGTTLISECWKTYQCLNDEGYVQEHVNHSITFTTLKTSTEQDVWSVVKRSLPPKGNGVLDSCLGEYMWRKHINVNDDMFFEFLKAVSMLYVPYECDE